MSQIQQGHLTATLFATRNKFCPITAAISILKPTSFTYSAANPYRVEPSTSTSPRLFELPTAALVAIVEVVGDFLSPTVLCTSKTVATPTAPELTRLGSFISISGEDQDSLRI